MQLRDVILYLQSRTIPYMKWWHTYKHFFFENEGDQHTGILVPVWKLVMNVVSRWFSLQSHHVKTKLSAFKQIVTWWLRPSWTCNTVQTDNPHRRWFEEEWTICGNYFELFPYFPPILWSFGRMTPNGIVRCCWDPKRHILGGKHAFWCTAR